MTLSAIDAKPALVVIDLQKGILAMPGGSTDDLKQVVEHAAELTAAFRSRGLPVALVSILGDAPGRTDVSGPADFTPQPDFADPVDELTPQPGDLRILRQRWSAFGATTLHDDLQKAGVTQVVLAGVATSIGVESSARAAHEHGYHVVLATDAMTDMNPDAHHNSTHHIFPRLGETTTTTDVLDKLQHAH